jgi:pyruvate/2-oxoglutarate dehydrogenase complex dihydrolipoamide acyltransferase (E2) component
MIAYWTDKRPNGQPIEAETFARVIDLEDGTNPIWTYGKTVDEVLQKIERQNGNAQLALARRATAQPNAPAQGAPTATPAAPRRRLSADEVMQLTTDLQNPAKAAAAIVKLAADETGVDPQRVAMDNFKKLAAEWEDEHEEFYQHPGNRTLLGIRAGY